MDVETTGTEAGAATTTAAAAATSAETAAKTAQGGNGSGTQSDADLEDGDWISKSTLDDNQKKYLKKVMSQNKNRKTELDEVKSKLSEKEKKEADDQRKRDEESGNWKKIAEESESKLKDKDQKLMRAELRAYAVKEGIVDPSIIDLLPLDGISLDDEGNVIGAEKFIGKYKKEKAYLFGETKREPEGTTTTKVTPAQNTTAVQKDGLTMTDAEFAVAEAEDRKRSKK